MMSQEKWDELGRKIRALGFAYDARDLLYVSVTAECLYEYVEDLEKRQRIATKLVALPLKKFARVVYGVARDEGEACAGRIWIGDVMERIQTPHGRRDEFTARAKEAATAGLLDVAPDRLCFDFAKPARKSSRKSSAKSK